MLRAMATRACLAPQGASGLKSFLACRAASLPMSRPARGEWIENPICCAGASSATRSRPARSEWIENATLYNLPTSDFVSPRKGRVDRKHVVRPVVERLHGSRPARGEWIEKYSRTRSIVQCTVSPRKGRVD